MYMHNARMFQFHSFFKGSKRSIASATNFFECLPEDPFFSSLVWDPWHGCDWIWYFCSKNINCYYWIYIRTYVFVDIYNEAQIVNKAFNLSCLLSLTMRLLLIFSTRHPALASPDDHNSPDSPCQHPIYTEHKYQHILHTRHIQKYCIPNNSGQMMP